MPLRDDNIEAKYFDVGQFATATLSLTDVRPQGTGPSGTVLVNGTLELHGTEVELKDLALSVERVDDGWNVATAAPIVLTHAMIGIDPAALLATCGHAGIDDSARVDVALHVTH